METCNLCFSVFFFFPLFRWQFFTWGRVVSCKKRPAVRPCSLGHQTLKFSWPFSVGLCWMCWPMLNTMMNSRPAMMLVAYGNSSASGYHAQCACAPVGFGKLTQLQLEQRCSESSHHQVGQQLVLFFHLVSRHHWNTLYWLFVLRNRKRSSLHIWL